MAKNQALMMLRLEGALQSWGENSKWDFRGSALLPAKSGIIGMIACAIGLERGNPRIDTLSDAITLAVRADRPGIRTIDYHTVTGHPLLTAEGKSRSTGNTVVSKRQYLQDASFLVVLQAAPDLLEEIRAALQNPKWCIFLGRKSCVPSRPVFDGIHTEYADIKDAIFRYPPAKRARFPLAYECPAISTEDINYTRTDAIVSASHRQFAKRPVQRGVVKEAANVSEQN